MNSSIEEKLTNELIVLYRTTGEEIGYWGRRFLQSVKRNGGYATVKRMLKPRTPLQRAGLDVLLDAGRPDLTVEAIILKSEYKQLFTQEELKIASERLGEYGKEVSKRNKNRDNLYPEILEPGVKYVEGAKKRVTVNGYERNSSARKACIAFHGCKCSVCNFVFEEKYGEIGNGFIHVHHLKPISLTNTQYSLDPVNDLRPVCPNCHAMLHRKNEVLSIEQLIRIIDKKSR
ncbi:MAG: HNH endonuclease [Candidatus Riflebacteria bacterium]|nr:HNH endonuclease [Candidatus Riflebacteria bacterium]